MNKSQDELNRIKQDANLAEKLLRDAVDQSQITNPPEASPLGIELDSLYPEE